MLETVNRNFIHISSLKKDEPLALDFLLDDFIDYVHKKAAYDEFVDLTLFDFKGIGRLVLMSAKEQDEPHFLALFAIDEATNRSFTLESSNRNESVLDRKVIAALLKVFFEAINIEFEEDYRPKILVYLRELVLPILIEKISKEIDITPNELH